MAEREKNVIYPEEVDFHVKSLRKYRVADIGKTLWFTNHEVLVKIHQQAVLEATEATNGREEVMKDALILEGKLKIFIHNAYAILVWRHKVLPELLKHKLSPQCSFLIYTIFFHEATLVGLLETLLFHPDACEALEETSLDLIDYCLQAIIQLIAGKDAEGAEDAENEEISVKEEIEKYQRTLQFRIGIRCLSILSFLVDNLEKISLSAVSRLVEIHDTPCVLSEILHIRPWTRHGKDGIEHFLEDEWRPVCGEEVMRVTKAEAHTWFCLREFLLNPRLLGSYDVTNFRQREISKCQGLLHDVLIDQLPPLGDLKQFLVTFAVAKEPGEGAQKAKKLLLEELPEIREKLLREVSEEGLEDIVREHLKVLSFEGSQNMAEIASKLTKAYNLDALEDLYKQEDAQRRSVDPLCALCGASAPKKCSKCRSIHYCSRECQMKHWKAHKPFCRK